MTFRQIMRRHLVSINKKCHVGFAIPKFGAEFQEYQLSVPAILNPHDVLVQVNAAGINPFDVFMSKGYGARLTSFSRDCFALTNGNIWGRKPFFPLYLGREFSGEVISVGGKVKKFKAGDEVFGAISVARDGSHCPFVLANECVIAPKPRNISHIEASSLPYVACTVWNAISDLKIVQNHSYFRGKNVLLTSSTGGIGTFALQLFRIYGAHVTAFARPSGDRESLLKNLGASSIIDYSQPDFHTNLANIGKFDFILDPIGYDASLLMSLAAPGASIVSLRANLLKNMDETDVIRGAAKFLLEAAQRQAKARLRHQCNYRNGFFMPNGRFLNQLRDFVEQARLKPVVSRIFDYKDIQRAYDAVAVGPGNGGKTVLNIAQ